jgi:hypothetical protein
MTLISHRARFIFLKTHKTASTSVEVALEGLCAPAGATNGAHYRPMLITEAGIIGGRGKAAEGAEWRNHMSARSVRAGIGRRIWRDYAKITTVRNPFDRMVSMFWSRMEEDRRETLIEEDFELVRMEFLAFLQGAGPSNNMNKLTIAGRYAIDHVLYFETLAEDFAELAVALQLPAAPLPRLKSDRRKRSEPWRDYYSRDARHIVERSAAFELAFFGYDFDGGPRQQHRTARAAEIAGRCPQFLRAAFQTPRKSMANGGFRP